MTDTEIAQLEAAVLEARAHRDLAMADFDAATARLYEARCRRSGVLDGDVVRCTDPDCGYRGDLGRVARVDRPGEAATMVWVNRLFETGGASLNRTLFEKWEHASPPVHREDQ